MIPALMPNYNRCDVALERGEGAYAFAADGTRYLDFMAGIAVNCLGHAHPHLVAALKAQAERLRQRVRERRLAYSGDVLEEHVTAREKRRDRETDDLPLPMEDRLDLLDEMVQ